MATSTQISKIIDLEKIPAFIAESRSVAKALEEALDNGTDDKSKLINVWDTMLKFGLYDETDLPIH